MTIWLIILGACGICLFANGSRSLALARKGESAKAVASAHGAGLTAAALAIIATALVLHWPFYNESISVPEEIHRTIVEVIDVPVQVTRWFFWKRTVMTPESREREIVETILTTRAVRSFSYMLAASLLVIGGVTYYVHHWCLRLWWVLRG